MDLKSGTLYWPDQNLPALQGQPLESDQRCEVVVIGSGITGALVGYHLTREGVDVIMVDRRPTGSGSTPASTALIQYEIDELLIHLADKLGQDHAGRAYLRCVAAVDEMRQLIDELGDPGNFTPRQSLYLACRPADVDLLRRECAARQRLGIEVRFLDGHLLREVHQLDRPAALLSDKAAQLDPIEALRHQG